MHGNLATRLRSVTVFECAGAATANGAYESASGSDLLLDGSPLAPQTIRVPCSGKLQPEHLLKAFEVGADLVVVLTCGDGDCRYLEGQRRIERRVDYVRGLLDEIGLGGERLLLLERPAGLSQDKWEAPAHAPADLAPSPLNENIETKG